MHKEREGERERVADVVVVDGEMLPPSLAYERLKGCCSVAADRQRDEGRRREATKNSKPTLVYYVTAVQTSTHETLKKCIWISKEGKRALFKFPLSIAGSGARESICGLI